jgi:1,4-alpha-glucan branching enzyme
MSIKKKFLKSKPVCKVTFKLENGVTEGADSVHLVGDFNNWDPKGTPMKALKSGAFTATLDLESGNEYQFRYLVNGSTWANEEEADKQVPTEFHDAHNSVIEL